MAGVLHVTNGDSAAERIRAAGLKGEILPWRDVLHEGPVPGKLGFAQLREVRAKFLSDGSPASFDDVLKSLVARDAMIDASGDRDEVILWFEHDLFDQLQLLQVLHRYGTQGPDPTRITLAVEPEYLGMLSIDRIRALHGRRTNLTTEQVRIAMQAWAAFTAPEAAAITRFLEENTAALPFVAPALRRHLEEFPSKHTGLSRSEQQALEAIDKGAATIGEAFVKSHHEREDAIFLGDLTFAGYLERMSKVGVPLVTWEDGTTIATPSREDDPGEYWKRRVVLTDAGRSVLRGDVNAVALNGIDRWLGGVHLEAEPGPRHLPPH